MQMTLDEDLPATVDRVVKELKNTRSSFTRDALRAAIRKSQIQALERERREDRMYRVLVLLPLLFLVICSGGLHAAGRFSDEPEKPREGNMPFKAADSCPQALQMWKTPEDINGWIHANFSYDSAGDEEERMIREMNRWPRALWGRCS